MSSAGLLADMKACPLCNATFDQVRVLETRRTSTGILRRRRRCLLCQHRWTTREPIGAAGRFEEGQQPGAGKGPNPGRGMAADNPIDRYGEWVMTKWNSKGFDTDLPQKTAEQLANAVLGDFGEGGELADIIKKLLFHRLEYTEEIDKKIKLELGDRMFYVVVLCKILDFDPSEIMLANMVKLNARYPDGFSAEKSNNRDTTKEG